MQHCLSRKYPKGTAKRCSLQLRQWTLRLNKKALWDDDGRSSGLLL